MVVQLKLERILLLSLLSYADSERRRTLDSWKKYLFFFFPTVMDICLGFVVLCGEFDGERCAFAFFALEGDFAVLGFNEAFHDS